MSRVSRLVVLSLTFWTEKIQVTLPKSKYISKRIKCEKCEKQFNKKETHKKHIETVHEVNFQCEQCDKKCNTKVAYQKHIETSHKVDFQYEQCENKFNTITSLQKHIKTVHENNFQCEQCDKKFIQARNYKMHMKNIYKNIVQQGCQINNGQSSMNNTEKVTLPKISTKQMSKKSESSSGDLSNWQGLSIVETCIVAKVLWYLYEIINL